MQDLIQVVNRLQDAFAPLGEACPVDLPQIAVVGGQSTGKSSVLESFVGRDFLPRGTGIVTRRPLILQLQHHPTEEYGTFLHCGERIFTDFGAIRDEISAETARLLGDANAVSAVPINLRIHSPNVVNLTLVDLPGMVKVFADAPQDMEAQILGMCRSFIGKDNCIILAVSAANADLANSDALKLAKEVDPQGLRTIGVLTKLDLMDQGTDARRILDNKVFPLRRGYVAVVNRSQRDIQQNKGIEAALAAERRFFTSHAAYSGIAERLGTPYLQRVLNVQLVEHIKRKLPELQGALSAKIKDIESNPTMVDAIHNAGIEEAGGATMQTHSLAKTVNGFATSFQNEVLGSGDIDLDTLSIGARIARLFQAWLPTELSRLRFDESVVRRQLRIAIKSSRGVRAGLFTPDRAFEAITKTLILQLRVPCFKCIEKVSTELKSAVVKRGENLARFPKLRDEVESLAMAEIQRCETEAKTHLSVFFEMEAAYVNTNHPQFRAEKPALESLSSPGAASGQGAEGRVLKKGWVTITNAGGAIAGAFNKSKEYWFVLKLRSLSWFKDEQETEIRYDLPTEGLRMALDGKKGAISIFHPGRRILYRDHKTLDLGFATDEDHEAWREALLRSGVAPAKTTAAGAAAAQEDVELDRQVEQLRRLVDSYITIVATTVADHVPKCCTLLQVERLSKFFASELLGSLYRNCADQESLLEESSEEVENRKRIRTMYFSTKQALEALHLAESSIRVEKLAPPPRPTKPEIKARPARPTPPKKRT